MSNKFLEDAIKKHIVSIYRSSNYEITFKDISFKWIGDDYTVTVQKGSTVHSYDEEEC